MRQVSTWGTDNALYRLGKDLVVRLPRIGWAVDDVAKEQRWLPLLAPHLPLEVPAPVALGAPGLGYPHAWSVYGWIDGIPPEEGDEALAADLAAFVNALHAVELPGGPPATRGVPLAQRDVGTRSALPRDLVPLWERALAARPYDGPPVWVHGDLMPGNLLVRDGRLAAVLDFGALGTGDPACDLLPAWNLLTPVARAVYRERLGVDDDTWERGRGWALSIAAGALSYYRDPRLALVQSSQRVLQALRS